MRYLFGWDFALYSTAPSLTITDSGASHAVTFSTGTYCHVDIQAVMGTGTYDDLATAIQTSLNAHLDFTNIYAVTWSASTGYKFEGDGVNFDITFTGTAGTNMKAILGMTGNRTGAQEYFSQCRPYYFILPAMPGRSLMTDEIEPAGIAEDASADDGTVYQVVKDTSEIHSDWTQTAETDTAPAAFVDGTPPFERHATSAVPWTYQHAFRHVRAGKQPFLVVDGSDTNGAVHEFRAEGVAFIPTRFAAQDFGLWNIPFKTRLLGRL